MNKANSTLLSNNWQIFDSELNKHNGSEISSIDFKAYGAITAIIPSTVFNAQVNNGIYKDIYVGENLSKISDKAYKNPWWYRKEFDLSSIADNYELVFEGINYKANIWLNGKLIADTNEINNAFKIYKFDVSNLVNPKKNVLALEIFQAKAGDFSIGFVDWNPAPPDNNMGIFRPVYLNSINKVQISDPYIESYFDNSDYSIAKHRLSLKLRNYTDDDINGVLFVNIAGKIIQKQIKSIANSNSKIILTADEYKELIIKNPDLWWPHTLGNPVLHELSFSFIHENSILCEQSLKYGIREIKDYYTKEGHRGFIVNGEKISIRGAGWVDNLMLSNTHTYDLAQLEYVKSMNLNTIRLEGFWGKDKHLYETCDELGILIMVGWSCHWEWEYYLGKVCDEKYGGILEENEIDLISQAWQDQIIWLRNHPSIFVWFSGSDCVPVPELEEKYMKVFHEYDSSRIYLSSAKEWESSDIQTGMKMRGPYAYVPPIYWFSDTIFGGAFGFNTETGPGVQLPPLESIKRMIPEKDLWPINDVWNYHCGRNEFNTLDRFTNAMNNRYGDAKTVEEYASKGQLMNYELMRPMFEAFSANRYGATGVIQWMLNSAWPEMYWQLYDSYLMPNAAFYATKKAGEPIHALYDYHENSIYLVNDKLTNEKDLKIRIKVFNIKSEIVHESVIKMDALKNSSVKIHDLKDVSNVSKTYFLDIRIEKGETELSNNFYWLSTKKDVLDYDKEVSGWNYHTPSKEYADFSQLDDMEKINVDYTVKVLKEDNYTIFDVELINQNKQIAFFINLSIMNKESGQTILPIIWDDNYISLTPMERRRISAKIKNTVLQNYEPQFELSGHNLKN